MYYISVLIIIIFLFRIQILNKLENRLHNTTIEEITKYCKNGDLIGTSHSNSFWKGIIHFFTNSRWDYVGIIMIDENNEKFIIKMNKYGLKKHYFLIG